ncbi:MAG: hypothetical protein ACFFD2_06265 [Promethearchaeota archaeon]
MNKVSISRESLEQKDIRQLLQLLSDSKRIQKAKTLYISDIKIIFQSDEGYMYEIKGTKQTYYLRIDLKNKVLIHNCDDWVHRGLRNNKLCKHFIRVFQLLYDKEAKRILIDLILSPWIFSDSDTYLKNL